MFDKKKFFPLLSVSVFWPFDLHIDNYTVSIVQIASLMPAIFFSVLFTCSLLNVMTCNPPFSTSFFRFQKSHQRLKLIMEATINHSSQQRAVKESEGISVQSPLFVFAFFFRSFIPFLKVTPVHSPCPPHHIEKLKPAAQGKKKWVQLLYSALIQPVSILLLFKVASAPVSFDWSTSYRVSLVNYV